MDLARVRPDLIVSKGELSRDACYARTTDVLGQEIRCPVRTLFGNHIAYALDPATFSVEVGGALDELRSKAFA